MAKLGWDLERNMSVGSEAPSLAKVVLWLQETIGANANTNANADLDGAGGDSGNSENHDPRSQARVQNQQQQQQEEGHSGVQEGRFCAKLSYERSPMVAR